VTADSEHRASLRAYMDRVPAAHELKSKLVDYLVYYHCEILGNEGAASTDIEKLAVDARMGLGDSAHKYMLDNSDYYRSDPTFVQVAGKGFDLSYRRRKEIEENLLPVVEMPEHEENYGDLVETSKNVFVLRENKWEWKMGILHFLGYREEIKDIWLAAFGVLGLLFFGTVTSFVGGWLLVF